MKDLFDNSQAQGKSAHAASRRKRAVNAFQSAAATIGEITDGMHLFAVTRGQFSMIDAILHTLDQVGESEISVWTWAIAAYEVESLQRLMLDKRISKARLIIDYSARERNADIIAAWQQLFGKSSVLYVRNHSKISTITAKNGKRVLLRGSMNLNFNPRFEQLDVTEGGADYDLVREIESELPVMPEPEKISWGEVAKLTGIDKCGFTQEQLNVFGNGLKIWAK